MHRVLSEHDARVEVEPQRRFATGVAPPTERSTPAA
jgi:hypothetical protein